MKSDSTSHENEIQLNNTLCISHWVCYFQLMFKVAISPSTDCPGVGCGASKSIRFSSGGGGGGGGSNITAEGPGWPFTLPPGGIDVWMDVFGVPAVADWEDGGTLVCFLFFLFLLCLRPLFGWWSGVIIKWVNCFILCAILPAWGSCSPALHLLCISISALSLSASRHWRWWSSVTAITEDDHRVLLVILHELCLLTTQGITHCCMYTFFVTH